MLQKIIVFITFLIIFITPLLATNFNFGYEHFKVLVFTILINILLLFWGIEVINKKISLKWSIIKTASTVFILVLFLSSFLSLDFQNSILGKQVYFQGFITYLYLYLFSLIVSSLLLSLTQYSKIIYFSSLVVSSWVIVDYLRLNFLGDSLPTYAGIVVGSFGQPNFYAGFLFLSLPFSYFWLGRKKKYLLSLGLPCLAILISRSESAFLLLLGLITSFLFSKLKHFKNIPSIFAICIIVLTLGLIFYIFQKIFLEEVMNPLQRQWVGGAVEQRLPIWQILGEQALDKFWSGYGLENIDLAYSSYFYNLDLFALNDSYAFTLKDLSVTRSHNYLLDLLLFAGVGAVISWLWLICLLFLKSKEPTLRVFLVLYLIWTTFCITSFGS